MLPNAQFNVTIEVQTQLQHRYCCKSKDQLIAFHDVGGIKVYFQRLQVMQMKVIRFFVVVPNVLLLKFKQLTKNVVFVYFLTGCTFVRRLFLYRDRLHWKLGDLHYVLIGVFQAYQSVENYKLFSNNLEFAQVCKWNGILFYTTFRPVWTCFESTSATSRTRFEVRTFSSRMLSYSPKRLF